MQTKMEENPLHVSLKKMVAQCQEMQKLLDHDIQSFSKNDLTTVAESNKRKTAIIGQLNAVMQEINFIRMKYDASSVNDIIEKVTLRTDTKLREQMQGTLQTLKNELSKAYKSLLTNSNIVFTNMQQLKDIWDQLLLCSNEMSCVYDQSGNTKR